MKLGKLTKLLALVLCFIPVSVFAYVGDEYVTPDSWNKHINANGIRSFTGGISVGDSGTLKMGYTTRAQVKHSGDTSWSIYEYARLRLSGTQVGNGELNLNINMRGAYNNTPAVGDKKYHKFYSGLYASRQFNEFTGTKEVLDGDFRIYQANIELNKVIPLSDLVLGRLYLEPIDGYKIDGLSFKVDPSEYFKIGVYYGLPVSYYSNLKTHVVGTNMEIPVSATGTKVQLAYSYFMGFENSNENTHVARARVDQNLNYDMVNANIYAEADVIGKAFVYELGFDTNVTASKTGISAYINGQATTNDSPINNYVSLYEGMMSSSKYVMGGLKVTQGIKDFMVIGLGYEGRFNSTIAYGDRDYHRVTGNIDLVGLIHRNNYLSLIVDYFNVAALGHQQASERVLGGFRMTQVFFDGLEAWMGVNVQNFQYRNNPIKMSGMSQGFDAFNNRLVNQNTTVAYIGGLYKPVDWCAIQLDYMFEYADLFKSADLQPDVHTVEMWLNFIW